MSKPAAAHTEAAAVPATAAVPRTAHRFRWLPVVATLLFGIIVSLTLLLHDQRNYQETYSLQIASGSGLPLWGYGSSDNPMPLYYLVLHGWVHIWTRNFSSVSTLTAARGLSLLWYGLAVIAAYAVGVGATGRKRIGTLAAVLLGLSPFMLWYGSRASAYAMLAFAVLFNQYFYMKLLERPRWWHWIGYILTGLFGLGTHYFFALVLLLQLVFYAMRAVHFRRRELLLMASAMIIFELTFGLWVHYTLLHTGYWHSLPFTSRPSATNTFIVYVQYLFGFQSVVTTTLIIAFWPLLVIFALLAIQKYVAPPVGVLYSLWAAVVPVLTMFALGWLWRPLFLSSYLIVCLPPLLLFLAWYFIAPRLKTLRLGAYALMAIMLIMFFIEATHPSRAVHGDYLGVLRSLIRTG